VHDRETAAASRREEDTVMANQRRVKDAQEKTAASARSPLLPAALGIVHLVNGRIVARPADCGPPHRRARG
jgi:hypothetical protein